MEVEFQEKKKRNGKVISASKGELLSALSIAHLGGLHVVRASETRLFYDVSESSEGEPFFSAAWSTETERRGHQHLKASVTAKCIQTIYIKIYTVYYNTDEYGIIMLLYIFILFLVFTISCYMCICIFILIDLFIIHL